MQTALLTDRTTELNEHSDPHILHHSSFFCKFKCATTKTTKAFTMPAIMALCFLLSTMPHVEKALSLGLEAYGTQDLPGQDGQAWKVGRVQLSPWWGIFVSLGRLFGKVGVDLMLEPLGYLRCGHHHSYLQEGRVLWDHCASCLTWLPLVIGGRDSCNIFHHTTWCLPQHDFFHCWPLILL